MSADILEQAFASTSAVVAQVGGDVLDAPTPCRSWTVRDLVNHIVGGTYYFAAIAEGDGPPDTSGGTPDFTGGDFAAEFADGAKLAVAAFRAPGAMEKTMKAPFGEIPGSMFVTIAATDTFTHGWDLAKATGRSTDLDPALATQLLEAARSFVPDAIRGDEGAPFGPAVEVPTDAPTADRLAGFLGRKP